MNMFTANMKGNTAAQLLKLLASSTRLSILEELSDGEQCVCHLEAHLGLRQAKISQDLSILRQAGLVIDRRDGWNVFYSLSDQRLLDLIKLARNLSGSGKTTIHSSEVDCPCPHCAKQTTQGEEK
jgi:ArsR family transcriptional regulator